jgi:hypothetical protein
MLNTRGFECSAGCQQFRATMCTCPSHSSGARYLIIVQFFVKKKTVNYGHVPQRIQRRLEPNNSVLLLNVSGTELLLYYFHHCLGPYYYIIITINYNSCARAPGTL